MKLIVPTFALFVLILCAQSTLAQSSTEVASKDIAATAAVSAGTTAPVPSMRIPANSTVYINAMDKDFHTYVAAALQKKKVPLIIVNDRSKADFEINGSVDKQKAGWAKTIFYSPMPSIDATMELVNIKTGVTVFTNTSTKNNANRGRKGSAEHLAKNLYEKMKNDGDIK